MHRSFARGATRGVIQSALDEAIFAEREAAAKLKAELAKKFNWTIGRIPPTRVHCLTMSTAAVDSIAPWIPGALSCSALIRSYLREAEECAVAEGTIEE